MKTKFWRLDSQNEEQILEEAAAIIRAGGTVAFPTETVYGLGADGLSEEAVQKIFTAKGRPADNPLILHVADKRDVYALAAEVSEAAQKLMDVFWPGPLTIIFKKNPCIPDAVTAGLDTVAVRMPAHVLANKFIALCGVPLAAPSANISGRPSPTEAQSVKSDLWGRIDGIIAEEKTQVGLESTVIDCSQSLPVILRPGFVTREQLAQVVVLSEADTAQDVLAPKAPGMKYTHYAPNAPVYLFDEAASGIAELCERLQASGIKVGIIAESEIAALLPKDAMSCRWSKQEHLAANLYSWLRELDARGAQVIFAQQVDSSGLGAAIMNRMSKAAGYKRITCADDCEQVLQDLGKIYARI